MSKKNSYLLGILLTVIIGTIVYYFTCCNCSSPDANTPVVTTPVKQNNLSNAFRINDANGNFKIDINDNFNFKTSGFGIEQPIADNVASAVDKLSAYLKANPSKSIDITGLYSSNETNNSAYPNLGIARATAVKNYFVAHGIPSKQMNTFGKLEDGLKPNDNGIILGPLGFDFSVLNNDSSSTPEDFNAVKTAINANPLILYFKTGEASINLSAEQRSKVAKIARYLDKVDNATIQIVGHTDNTGNRNGNIKLGQDRADFAKNYFIKNGIPESKILTSSKGPDQPITSNDTPEGRRKNRRTTVTIN